MKKHDAVAILAALAQDNRLDVFRLLVEAGHEGMPAGHIAASLRLPPSALTFHLDRLREVGLVSVRRDGRLMIYSARFEAMNALVSYLTDHCCQGRPELCAPSTGKTARRREKVR
jgi:ArsR family transcriptional regulator, arsenate/arsenite/antimonite-responsive transcriptional repressor